MTVLEWPAQNADMNLIENDWELLDERTNEKNSRNIERLI